MSEPAVRGTLTARQHAPGRIRRVALIGTLPVLLLACSAATRYTVLAFLFDGVPDPSKQPAPEFVGPPLPPARFDLTQPAPGSQQYRQHAPYAERKCAACHVDRKGGGGGVLSGLQLQDLGQLRLPKDELCFTCHPLPERKHHHAPALLGDCLRCHNPHASAHPALLHRPTPNELCRTCHVGDPLPSSAAHAAWGDRSCADCHDPHASDLRYFLRPDWERQGPADPAPGSDPLGPPPPPGHGRLPSDVALPLRSGRP